MLRSIVIKGELDAVVIAIKLTRASKWYEFTPLPNNEFEFLVKDEAGLPDEFFGAKKWRISQKRFLTLLETA